MNNQDQLRKVGNFVQEKVLTYDWIFCIIIALFTIIYFQNISIPVFLSTPLFSILSLIYFLSAYSYIEAEDAIAFDRFAHKLISFSSSITMVGILFSNNHWAGSSRMLFIGITILIIALVYILLVKSKRPETTIFNKIIIIRLALLILCAALILYKTNFKDNAGL